MDGTQFAVIFHAGVASVALLLGPVNLLRKKRDIAHRRIGLAWVVAMYLTCGTSFFVGMEEGFSFLHGLSIFTIGTVSLGLWAVMTGRYALHGRNMAGSYFGLVSAFIFAVIIPDRLIWQAAVGAPLRLAGFVLVVVLISLAVMWVSGMRLPRRVRSRALPEVLEAPGDARVG